MTNYNNDIEGSCYIDVINITYHQGIIGSSRLNHRCCINVLIIGVHRSVHVLFAKYNERSRYHKALIISLLS